MCVFENCKPFYFWENDQVHLGEVYFQNEEKTKKKKQKQTVNQSFKDYSKPPSAINVNSRDTFTATVTW